MSPQSSRESPLDDSNVQRPPGAPTDHKIDYSTDKLSLDLRQLKASATGRFAVVSLVIAVLALFLAQAICSIVYRVSGLYVARFGFTASAPKRLILSAS